MQGKVEICGVNTSRLKVLKSDEMKELLVKSHNGDKSARDALIYGNLRLVLSVIQRFGNRGESPDDLFQVGCVGLIKAIDNFDESLNVKFSTYAVPMIIGEIRRYLRDNNSVRVSRSIRDTAYRALKVKEEIVKKFNYEPTPAEIAKILDVDESEINFALDAISDTISLNEPVYTDGNETVRIMDQIASVNDDENLVEKMTLNDAIKNLSDREKEILLMRYYVGKTQMEVSGEVGISQAQVSRLEKTALKTLRNFFE